MVPKAQEVGINMARQSLIINRQLDAENTLKMFSSFKPFTEVAAPFSIGLKPVDPARWLYTNPEFQSYQKQKLELYKSSFDAVFMATKDSAEAQAEIEAYLSPVLEESSIIPESGLDVATLPPLARAALKVQDDLIIMRRKSDGWNLVAGSVCFPAHWNLSEKFNRPLESIHGPVPMDKKMHQRINRIFDSLQPSIPVWRENWSLDSDDELRKEKSEHMSKHKAQSEFARFYFRTEYQTLHKMPVSGDVLFTIGTYITHLDDLKQLHNGQQMLQRFKGQVESLSADEVDYKGMTHCYQSLIDWLTTEIES